MTQGRTHAVNFRVLHCDERGQDLVEYGLLAMLVSIAALSAVQSLGVSVLGLWNTIVTTLEPYFG